MRWLVLSLSVAVSCGALAQSPESVVQGFVDALNRKDFEAASKLVKGGSVPPYLKDVLATDPFPTWSLSDLAADPDWGPRARDLPFESRRSRRACRIWRSTWFWCVPGRVGSSTFPLRPGA